MIKFHKLGIKHERYLKRFKQKYNIDKFELNKIDQNLIQIVCNAKVIDEFHSESNFKQFIVVLLSFNLIEETTSGYLVIQKEINWNYLTDAIFEHSKNEKIKKYRNSRKICLLQKIGLLDKKIIKKLNIQRTRGIFNAQNCVGEISYWENETTSCLDKLIYALKGTNKWIQNLK